MRSRLAVPCTLVLLLFALPVLAGEGRIPVWRSPTVISAPGQYVLTRHITPNPLGGPAIDIQAPDVDLDLNGFTVDNTGVPAPAIHVPIPDRVRIHNGFILGGNDSVAAPGGGTRIILEGIKAHAPAVNGFFLFDVETVVIRDCLITGADQWAIWIDGGGWKNGHIEHNVIKTSGGGIYVQRGSSLALRFNQLENLTSPSGLVMGPGIQLVESKGILVEENTVESAQGGIELARSSGCKLFNNVIKETQLYGILVDQGARDNYLLHNVVTGTQQGDGILVDGARNHLDDNLSNANVACGIHFSPVALDNVYRKNVARGNACPPVLCVIVSTSDFCDDGVNDSTNNDNFLPFPGM